MKAISGKQMCKILGAKGWTLARVTGNHHIFVTSGQNVRISVPVHGNQDLKIGLQRALMRLAGIREDEL
jgi:predicted RNA binding protein YcfA (HicA-like mRNA interferase family)